jgi:PleD family two-component response regulator
MPILLVTLCPGRFNESLSYKARVTDEVSITDSQFRSLFLLVERPMKNQKSQGETPESRGLVRILYVDDYPLDRELVKDALEKEHGGFHVTEAASREAFEKQLGEGDFDLVLSDFNILGFEGLQVLQAVNGK